MVFRLFALLVLLQGFGTAWATVPGMTKEELREQLGDERVVILDVRHSRDWQASDRQIPGAIRIADGDFTPIGTLPRDRRYVLYCA